MRLCFCRQVPLVKRLRVGIEARDLVPMHDRNIDVAIWARRRIAGELGGRYLPLAYLPLNLWPTSWCDAVVRPPAQATPVVTRISPTRMPSCTYGMAL